MFDQALEWSPDPSRGLFETLLVVEGRAIELEAHLRRLAPALREIYAQELPPEVGARAREAATEISLGRLRVTAAPGDTGLQIDLLAGEVPPETVFPRQGVKLRAHRIAGGLGPHKWAHRPGINRPAPGTAGALIVDEGEILEAGWANVFAVRGGTLFTPPLDGRLLPGTTRATVLELAAELEIEAHEEPLGLRALWSAEETFLTGSIRGIEPALELDGQPLAGCGEISHRLASALRRRWGLPSDSDDPATPAAEPTADQLSR